MEVSSAEIYCALSSILQQKFFVMEPSELTKCSNFYSVCPDVDCRGPWRDCIAKEARELVNDLQLLRT